MNTKNEFRIGLMGCGQVANYGHLPSIASTPGLKLAAVFDPDQGRLDKVKADHPGTATHQTSDAFFADNLDAVVITSPAPRHAENALAAAEAGLPVLCEKPLAQTPEEGQAMIESCAAHGVPLHVAYCYRYSPVALTIHRLIREGAIGEVKFMRLIYVWDLHGMYDDRDAQRGTVNSRYHHRMLEGGPMVDCGVHQIDLAQWWTDSTITAVHGVGAWVEGYDAPDQIWGHLDHDNGVHTCVEMSYSLGHQCRTRENHFRYEIRGSEGIIVYDRMTERFEMKNTREEIAFPFVNEKNFPGLYEAYEHMLRTGDDRSLCSGAQGLRNTDLAAEITAQAQQSRATALSPA